MKTKVTLRQSIENLSRLNTHGSYTERIRQLWNEYDDLMAVKTKTTRVDVKYSPEELEAITQFYLDPNFNTKD